MGQSADELRLEIEQTRMGLGDTLDAIGDRVSPGRVIERRKNRVVNSVQSVRDRVMGSMSSGRESVADTATGAVDTIKSAPDAVRDQTTGSPLVAGGLAFGLGFLLAAVFPPSRPEQQAAQQLMDKAEPLKDELASAGQDVAAQVKETALGAVEELKGAATEGAQAVSETAQHAVHDTKATAVDGAETVKAEATDAQ